MSIINLPVSFGEALDKLTILDIKKKKITDNRLKDVEKEYNILYEKLKKYINKYNFYYTVLKQINLDIWEMQDDFRYNDGNKSELCIKIIEENDRRFRVKKKINDITNSELKEQKGYKLKKAFVLTHLGLGDNITAIGMVRYLSTCYDEVLVVCWERNKENVKLFYQDDSSIKLYDIQNGPHGLNKICTKHGCPLDKFNNITKGYDLYLVGIHSLTHKFHNTEIPLSFYKTVDIDPSYFWKFFYIPTTQYANELFSKLEHLEYVFIHNMASNGKAFNLYDITKTLQINKKRYFFINPNINHYEKTNPLYELANNFIGHRLIHYTEIIKNANYNIMTDSSFFCMALNLEIEGDKNYYFSRDNRNYDILYSKKYKFVGSNKKIFKNLRMVNPTLKPQISF